MSFAIELTGAGLKLLRPSGNVALALAAGPDEVTLILADPAMPVGADGRVERVAIDYPLSLTAARHLKERLAIAIAEAEHLERAAAEPVEPLVPRRTAA